MAPSSFTSCTSTFTACTFPQTKSTSTVSQLLQNYHDFQNTPTASIGTLTTSSVILTTSVSSFLASIFTLMASIDTFIAINSLSRLLVTLSGPLQALSGLYKHSQRPLKTLSQLLFVLSWLYETYHSFNKHSDNLYEHWAVSWPRKRHTHSHSPYPALTWPQNHTHGPRGLISARSQPTLQVQYSTSTPTPLPAGSLRDSERDHHVHFYELQKAMQWSL